MKSLLDLLEPPPPVRRSGERYAVEPTGKVWSLENPGNVIKPKVDRRGFAVLPDKTLVHHLVSGKSILFPEIAPIPVRMH